MTYYCSGCKKVVEYDIKSVKLTRIVKGVGVSFDGEQAYCSECGRKINPPDVVKRNILAAEQSENRSR